MIPDFLTWLENQENRDRWLRRKAKHHKDHSHSKQGMGGGNPRFSGKGGIGHTPRPNDFRAKGKQDYGQEE